MPFGWPRAQGKAFEMLFQLWTCMPTVSYLSPHHPSGPLTNHGAVGEGYTREQPPGRALACPTATSVSNTVNLLPPTAPLSEGLVTPLSSPLTSLLQPSREPPRTQTATPAFEMEGGWDSIWPCYLPSWFWAHLSPRHHRWWCVTALKTKPHTDHTCEAHAEMGTQAIWRPLSLKAPQI